VSSNTLTFTDLFPATAVNLLTLASFDTNGFSVFSNTGISNTGVTSIIGDIGVGPGVTSTAITGNFALNLPAGGAFSTSPLVTGKVYAYDYGSPTPTSVQQASSDLTTAYNAALNPAPTVTNDGAGNLGGLTLVPGVYKFTTGVTIPTNLTLNGGAGGVWIFQIPGTLDISSAKSVILSGGAVPANVFWAVAGTTTLETTSTFQGTILSGPGTSTIAMLNGATLKGRALGQTAVTLIGDSIVNSNVSAVTAVGTAAATAHVSTITYTLTTGTFDGAAGIVPSNWTLGCLKCCLISRK
jgi:hypothetical protein